MSNLHTESDENPSKIAERFNQLTSNRITLEDGDDDDDYGDADFAD